MADCETADNRASSTQASSTITGRASLNNLRVRGSSITRNSLSENEKLLGSPAVVPAINFPPPRRSSFISSGDENGSSYNSNGSGTSSYNVSYCNPIANRSGFSKMEFKTFMFRRLRNMNGVSVFEFVKNFFSRKEEEFLSDKDISDSNLSRSTQRSKSLDDDLDKKCLINEDEETKCFGAHTTKRRAIVCTTVVSGILIFILLLGILEFCCFGKNPKHTKEKAGISFAPYSISDLMKSNNFSLLFAHNIREAAFWLTHAILPVGVVMSVYFCMCNRGSLEKDVIPQAATDEVVNAVL